MASRLAVSLEDGIGLGKIQTEIFERTVESQLIAPTFITEYPAEVSPLARRSDHDPCVTDRFELMVAWREIANSFGASAFAKRYVDEPGTHEVIAWCERAHELALSVIVIPEIVSAFCRLQREAQPGRRPIPSVQAGPDGQHRRRFDL